MNDWSMYAVAGLAQLSLLMALYKIPSAKNISKYTLSVWTYFFATLLAGAVLYHNIFLDPKTIFLSFLWGTGYAILTLMQMHVLHKQDTGSVFPFTSLASNIFVVIGGVFFLSEVVSAVQWLAISLSIALFIASYWNSKMHVLLEILPSFMFIALLSTFNKFVQKNGADHVNTQNFIFWEMAFALIASIVILLMMRKNITLGGLVHRHLLKWALISGILQFGATYSIIKALAIGPISLVYIILGLYTFFTSLLAALFFKEKLTLRSLFFIFCSFLIVLLIKFGK